MMLQKCIALTLLTLVNEPPQIILLSNIFVVVYMLLIILTQSRIISTSNCHEVKANKDRLHSKKAKRKFLDTWHYLDIGTHRLNLDPQGTHVHNKTVFLEWLFGPQRVMLLQITEKGSRRFMAD